MPFFRNLAGSLGKAIDSIPGGNKTGSLFGNPYIDVSATLQNYGGNQSGSIGSAVVRPQSQVLGAQDQQLGPVATITNDMYGPNPITDGGGGGGGGGFNTNQNLAGLDTLQQDINRSTEDLGSIIDRDFESALSDLSVQEQNLRASAGTAEQGVRAQAQQARTALQNQQQTALSGIGTEEQQAQTTANSALQQARDINRQIQQQNVAQLSSMGISSSSVAEALAEKLGVETARRIGGITGSRDEILQNLQAERSRINNVAQQKLSDLEQSVGVQISEIQNNLLAGLRQINSARDTAARDKANRRAELLSSAQSQIANLKAQAQQFQQQLQEAAARRQASVAETLNLLTATPQDFGNLTGNIQALAPALQSTGLDYGINVNAKGQPTFSFTTPKQDDEEETIF